MKLNSLNFVISDSKILTEEEKNFLVEAYRKMFIKVYGCDVFDAFGIVANINKDDIKSIADNNQKFAQNYERAKDALESLSENDLSVLLIYKEDRLVGGGRLKTNYPTIKVLDIALDNIKIEEEREIWKSAILFVEQYFAKQKFERIYIEIPLKEGPLLIRANELGFKEDFYDIEDDKNTYLLNKKIESIKDE